MSCSKKNLTKAMMKIENLENLEEQVLDVEIELNKLESLARALFSCTIEEGNFEPCDTSNLSIIVLEQLKKIKNKYNNIEELMQI